MTHIKSWIVCAAIRHKNVIITGARHFDTIMHNQLIYYNLCKGNIKDWEQSFIDQFGNFYNREEVMKIIKNSPQIFIFKKKHNGGNDKLLYSEDLY